MQKTFKFDQQKTALNEITINQVGNFVIEAISEEDQFYYYLLVKTYLGTTYIVSYGPIIPDLEALAGKYSLEYEKISYNETKLVKFVNKWLNDSKKNITIVNEIEEKDFIANMKDVSTAILNIK